MAEVSNGMARVSAPALEPINRRHQGPPTLSRAARASSRPSAVSPPDPWTRRGCSTGPSPSPERLGDEDGGSTSRSRTVETDRHPGRGQGLRSPWPPRWGVSDSTRPRRNLFAPATGAELAPQLDARPPRTAGTAGASLTIYAFKVSILRKVPTRDRPPVSDLGRSWLTPPESAGPKAAAQAETFCKVHAPPTYGTPLPQRAPWNTNGPIAYPLQQHIRSESPRWIEVRQVPAPWKAVRGSAVPDRATVAYVDDNRAPGRAFGHVPALHRAHGEITTPRRPPPRPRGPRACILVLTGGRDLEAEGHQPSAWTAIPSTRSTAARARKPERADFSPAPQRRFVGEPIAFNRGPPRQAKDAAELIEVDIDDLPVHKAPAEGARRSIPRRRANHRFEYGKGDREATEAAQSPAAAHVVTVDVHTTRVIVNSMFNAGAACRARRQPPAHFCSTGRASWSTKKRLARMLGLRPGRLRRDHARRGGGFGMNASTTPMTS